MIGVYVSDDLVKVVANSTGEPDCDELRTVREVGHSVHGEELVHVDLHYTDRYGNVDPCLAFNEAELELLSPGC